MLVDGHRTSRASCLLDNARTDVVIIGAGLSHPPPCISRALGGIHRSRGGAIMAKALSAMAGCSRRMLSDAV
jgi:hypothetical protein